MASDKSHLNQSLHIFTARKRSLGQGNIFTRVCHSVHRGGGVSVWCHFLLRESLSRGSLSRGVSLREIPLPGDEQAVCILLECFLLTFDFTEYGRHIWSQSLSLFVHKILKSLKYGRLLWTNAWMNLYIFRSRKRSRAGNISLLGGICLKFLWFGRDTRGIQNKWREI